MKSFGLIEALQNSIDGLKNLLRERAFCQELAAGIFVCLMIICLNIAYLFKLYIFSSYCLILLMETINTCIETVVNRISMEIHPLSKLAKDMGSAGVLISIFHFLIVLVLVIVKEVI